MTVSKLHEFDLNPFFLLPSGSIATGGSDDFGDAFQADSNGELPPVSDPNQPRWQDFGDVVQTGSPDAHCVQTLSEMIHEGAKNWRDRYGGM